MAVSGNLKGRILEDHLPSPTLFNDYTYGYVIRYRIASEDRNRYSHYSPTYRVLPNYSLERPYSRGIGDIYTAAEGLYAKIVFDPISIKDKVSGSLIRQALEYDVWARFDKGDGGVWTFQQRVEGTSLGYYVPETYVLENGTFVDQKPNRMSIEIYLRSSNPQRITPVPTVHPLLVYKLDNVTV